jgi:hypothetical protein
MANAATADVTHLRAKWIAELSRLMSQIEKWALAEGWLVARRERELCEEPLGMYSAPALTIQTPRGVLVVDPVARAVVGADGRVDLCAFPTYHRLLLVQRHRGWVLMTDSGVEWPGKWSKKTFIDAGLKLVSAK